MKDYWRFVQVAINAATIIAGFCTFMPLSYIQMYFTGLCILYTDIQLSALNATAPSLEVDVARSVWGSSSSCNYPTYTSVVAGIHAFVWCWYFLLVKRQLKIENKEFPLLVISVLTHAVMLVAILVASGMVSAGADSWCYSLVKEVNRLAPDSDFTCADTQLFNWTNVYQTRSRHIQDFLLTAKISSWIQTISILAQVLVCGYILYLWILGSEEISTNSSKDHSNKSLVHTNESVSMHKGDETERKGGSIVTEAHVHVPHGHSLSGQSYYKRLDDEDDDT